MRIRFRYSLTTLLLLPLLVGIGIKWFRGPREYSEIVNPTAAKLAAQELDPLTRCIVRYPRQVSFWAYRNLDGSLTRHGQEISVGTMAPSDKLITEFRGGQRNGAFRYWDAAGDLVCEGQFENDEPTGTWTYYRYGIAYQRVQYDIDEQNEIQSRYDLGQLAERRVRARGSDDVQLTAWHWQPKPQKRVEGRLLKDRPVGKWHWWDEAGREILAVTFHDGVPAEFVGRSKLLQFMAADFETNFENLSLESVVGYLESLALPLQIQESVQQARRIGISTGDELRGGLALYVALRKAGLTLDTRTEKDGTESLVIVPTGKG
jgi:hypothetical protein